MAQRRYRNSECTPCRPAISGRCQSDVAADIEARLVRSRYRKACKAAKGPVLPTSSSLRRCSLSGRTAGWRSCTRRCLGDTSTLSGMSILIIAQMLQQQASIVSVTSGHGQYRHARGERRGLLDEKIDQIRGSIRNPILTMQLGSRCRHVDHRPHNIPLFKRVVTMGRTEVVGQPCYRRRALHRRYLACRELSGCPFAKGEYRIHRTCKHHCIACIRIIMHIIHITATSPITSKRGCWHDTRPRTAIGHGNCAVIPYGHLRAREASPPRTC